MAHTKTHMLTLSRTS